MGWKLVEVPEEDGEDVLTDEEVVSMSVTLNLVAGPKSRNGWQKIQPAFQKAIAKMYAEDAT